MNQAPEAAVTPEVAPTTPIDSAAATAPPTGPDVTATTAATVAAVTTLQPTNEATESAAAENTATAVATSEATAAATSEATAEANPSQGGTLPIRIAEPIPDLKPWDLRSRGEEYVATLLYNGLVRLDDTLKPQPDLAESWETSEDGKLITFTLRSGIEWHDGEPLTAEDVAWTLETLRAMTATNTLIFDLRMVISEIQTPLEDTVVVSTTQAYAPLLANLAVPILPRHLLQDRSPEELAEFNFWDEPVGSGPFTFVERSEQGITFARNEQFFRGAPRLEGVALVVSPDPDVTMEALNDGTLLLAEFGDESGAEAALDQVDANLHVGGYPENGSYFLAFNVRAERVFSETNLRQALALAVDVPELVQEVTDGEGEPLVTSISPAAWAFPAQLGWTEPDLERAGQLLDEAGWTLPADGTIRERDGNRLTAQIFVRGDDPRRVEAAERIAAAAEQIGMDLEVVPSDFESVILSKLAPPYDFDLLLGSWVNAPNSAGFPTNYFYDPDDYGLFSVERSWAGPNDTRTGLRNIGGFSNPGYEREAQQARTTYAPDERAEAIEASQGVIRRELPYLFLWTNRIPVVLHPSVQREDGEIPLTSPRYLWDIERWYLAEE